MGGHYHGNGDIWSWKLKQSKLKSWINKSQPAYKPVFVSIYLAFRSLTHKHINSSISFDHKKKTKYLKYIMAVTFVELGFLQLAILFQIGMNLQSTLKFKMCNIVSHTYIETELIQMAKIIQTSDWKEDHQRNENNTWQNSRFW